ncbi:MAG: hypothetical protein WC026_13245 [Hyphomicrobium sp.]|uniref:hypothetical protein n=1 Tax=Hyphomicrobium sp. TaxID=82 RepID=UPI0035642FDA
MEIEEIVKNNIIIAKFLGVEIFNNDTKFNLPFGCKAAKKGNYDEWANADNNGFVLNVDFLEYHESWDALIPVIQKLKELKIEDGILVNDSAVTFVNELGKIKRHLIRMELEKTWLATVGFINWHNKIKNK